MSRLSARSSVVWLNIVCLCFLLLFIYACTDEQQITTPSPESPSSYADVTTDDAPDLCGVVWAKSGSNPLMTGGFSGGDFDITDVRTASVLYDAVQDIYEMWYSGLDNASPPRSRIGYATSPDGIAWTPCCSSPVIDLGPPGAFDDWHAYFPTVIKDGSLYKMWYTGDAFGRHYLGYATSPDGINWTKYPGGQFGGSILDWQAEGWDRYAQATSIMKDGSVYKMWFGELGASGGIGYATSTDGINWTIVGQVLAIGASGTFEEWRIYWPSVVRNGAQYTMLYAGQNIAELRRFGLATSSDGINWVKYSGNPVLPLGGAGEMDDIGHYYPHMVLEAGVLKMWYSGHGNGLSIGYAESVCPKDDVNVDIKPRSCPNPIDPKSSGKLPVAILGTSDFDVQDIDVSTVLLEGVAPFRNNVEDVSTPAADGDECDCTEDGPDGYEDLTLKFETQDIISAIGPVTSGDVKELTITGFLLDGTRFESRDCVIVVGGKEGA